MHARQAGRIISILALVALLCGSGAHAGAVGTASNLVGNAGFETAAAAWSGGGVPVTVGNWTAVHPGATQVSAPVHSGAQSASTQALAGGTGAFFEQDFQNFPFNQSYSLSFWVYPQQGTQVLGFDTGWDRGTGYVTGSVGVSISPSGTTFQDWDNVTAIGPALTYGQWHQITIIEDACTQAHTWSIDGQPVATTATTVPAPQLGTIIFGQVAGTSPENDQFYWDDVSLQTIACPSASSPPVVNAGPPATIDEGSTFTSAGTFTDLTSSSDSPTSSSLVGNAGFEAAAATWSGGGVPVTVGNWTAVNPGATEAGAPAHGGAQSASTQAFANGSSAFFEQDFQNFPFNQSYSLSFWVYPQQGTQGFQFMTGWDRSSGARTGVIYVGISPSGTTFGDWNGVTAAGPALTYGQWHHITIVQDACTQTHTWSIDGQQAATTTTTVPAPQLGTLLFGQGANPSPENDQFYWDDVSLQTIVCPSAGGPPTATVDYGDGSGTQPLTLNADQGFTLSHTYGAAGVYTVTVAVTNGAGQTGSATTTVTVRNVAPTVTSLLAPLTPTQVNTAITASATFTDPGIGYGDTHTAVWDWGDGTTSAGAVNEASGSGSVSGSHTYTADGVYTVTVTVTDDNGATGSLAATHHVVVYGPSVASGGNFAIGDLNAAAGNSVYFWGAQWAKRNSLSGGPAPDAFKGFAQTLSAAPPTCGDTWTAGPGNSSAPPATVPTYMAAVVSSQITRSGGSISGNITKVVIVKTDAGYQPDPGHVGTGTIVATLCG